MAGKNQVTLTFAGDSTKLTKAFDEVGSSARTMDTDVGSASRGVSGSLDKAGDAADGAEGKAQGFSDTLTGTKDVMGGVGEIAKGNLFEGFVMAGQGAADLAGGMASFLIPMGKAGLLKAFAAGQWLVNAAMSANPIGLVVIAIIALIAIIVIAWKKSDTFRAIVTGAFNAVWSVVKKVGAWFKDTLWPLLKGVFDKVGQAAGKVKDGVIGAFNNMVGWLKGLPGKVGGYFKGVTDAGAKVIDWFKALPGKIAGFFSGLGSTISRPFSSAFQGIKDLWNSTVGGKGFSVPGWIPGIGGKGFTIPYFHTGGIVPGGLGSETLAVLKAGERVTGGSNRPPDPAPAGDTYVYVTIDGQQLQGRITKTVRNHDRQLKRDVKAG